MEIQPSKTHRIGGCADRQAAFRWVKLALEVFAAAWLLSCNGGGASSGGGGFGLAFGTGATGPGICGTSAKALSTSCPKTDNGDIEIGAGSCGPDVYLDQSFIGKNAFNTIKIDSGATLCFPDQTAELDVGQILVNGTLQVGQKTNPIGTADPTTLVTLNFIGTKSDAGASDPNCVDPVSKEPFRKGIEVCKGGSLEMYGLKGVSPNGLNWTYLSKPAGPPDKYGKGTGVAAPVGMDGNLVLHLADDAGAGTGAWRPMDWIAVGSTSFSPFDTEIVQIVKVVSKPPDNPSGSDVYIMQPLKHYHFGSAAPESAATYPSPASYTDGPSQNYGVDERAPVALISRNIKLTAAIPANDPANLHWGGETKFLLGFKEVSIQGVELQKFGKDHLGSYPIHFHKDGDLSKTPYAMPPLVDSDSIDHSYNKCVTVHSTQNLTVSNIVCVRAVGHLFYEEIGDETNTTFMHDLGMGAMSNSFDIHKTDKFSRGDLIREYWWSGDYMTNNPASPDYIGYDGFNVPDMDNPTNPVHGSCAQINAAGQLFGYTAPQAPPNPTCPAGQYYVEPASGFWITNPSTRLIGNIVDGCQGVGVGYWYVTAPINAAFPQVNNNQYLPVGTFKNDRVSGCFDGLFGENAYSVQSAALLHPHVGGTPGGQNLLATFDGLTATRNRDRGVWMRDQWFVLDHGRFALNRDSASLLTAGGADGATPGDWMLVADSVFEGISQNNVDRFGPCSIPDTTFSGQQVLQGCIDLTPAGTAPSGDEIGKGYPDPNWNLAGYMIYDGPAKLLHDRFVDFKVDIKPELTTDDRDALMAWVNAHKLTDEKGNLVPWVYEGDAALGWFQSNQSSYPTLTNSAKLSFVNTDLRHQIYTQLVNLGKDPQNPLSGFGDGDKNTAIIDLDGTLAGYQALDSFNDPVTKFDGPHPVSLNNLMINASGNSVDECHSQGGQDEVLEKRPTSLMSPSSMASLELQMLYPPSPAPNPPPPFLQKQNITFSKDSVDFGEHQSMTLSSRNALGVWEPKVTSGLGYTITASVDKTDNGTLAGIPKVVDIGLLDAYKPHISSSNPFYVRVGICYTSADGTHPTDPSEFTIVRGYHSYGGGVLGSPDDLELRKYYNKLDKLYTANNVPQVCDNLDGVNFDAATRQTKNLSCPAYGISLLSQGCPTGMTAMDNRGQMVCLYPPQNLSKVPGGSLSDLTNSDGSYKDLDQYYYDAKTGWLFFYVAQRDPNAIGPSPLGSCGATANPKDPACPDTATDESYYVCPAQGCTDYVITLNDPNYTPGPSNCPDPYSAGRFGLTNGAAVPEPKQPYRLVLAGTTTDAVRQPMGDGTDFPHYAATTEPDMCK